MFGVARLFQEFDRRLNSVVAELIYADRRDWNRAIYNARVAAQTPSHLLGRGVLLAEERKCQLGKPLLHRNFNISQVSSEELHDKTGIGVLGRSFVCHGKLEGQIALWVKSHYRLDDIYTLWEWKKVPGPGPNGQPFGFSLGKVQRTPWAGAKKPPYFVWAHGHDGTVVVSIRESGKQRQIRVDGDTFARIMGAAPSPSYRAEALSGGRPTVLVVCGSGAPSQWCAASHGEESVLEAVQRVQEAGGFPEAANYGAELVVGIVTIDKEAMKGVLAEEGMKLPPEANWPQLATLCVRDKNNEHANPVTMGFRAAGAPAADLGELGSLTLWPTPLPEPMPQGVLRLPPPKG